MLCIRLRTRHFWGNGAKKHTKLRKGLYTLALRIDRAQVLDYLE